MGSCLECEANAQLQRLILNFPSTGMCLVRLKECEAESKFDKSCILSEWKTFLHG